MANKKQQQNKQKSDSAVIAQDLTMSVAPTHCQVERISSSIDCSGSFMVHV